MTMSSATGELRRMLDDRGVEWQAIDGDGICFTEWSTHGGAFVYTARESHRRYGDDRLRVETSGIPNACMIVTPEQAIEATLGREPWISLTWERWHKSLRHDEIKSIGDAVEQLMYEAIEFGGDMGPNGNTYNGIDEGDVLTSGFINEWIARFEATLGPGTCHITVKDNLAETEGLGDVWLECDECHWQMPLEPSTPRFNFCPNCGKRIEES